MSDRHVRLLEIVTRRSRRKPAASPAWAGGDRLWRHTRRGRPTRFRSAAHNRTGNVA